MEVAESGAADPEEAARHRWVCLDVGETLLDETRIWSDWADVLGVPRLTFMAAFGAAIERGGEYRDTFKILGQADWRDFLPRVRERYGTFQMSDLYPDALPALADLRALGYRVAIAANQPARRGAELRALGFEVEVMFMSEEIGVDKPDPVFFEATLKKLGRPDPGDVAYVGDRIDNDVLPASAAGMRAVWLRRGPNGVIPVGIPPQAALVVDSLAELVERIGECWAAAPGGHS
jgi:haloacid dehalogenase superfamily, subfamily IA, variant 1 with third motif having Dx(3-4)D or Dx(3-4)E